MRDSRPPDGASLDSPVPGSSVLQPADCAAICDHPTQCTISVGHATLLEARRVQSGAGGMTARHLGWSRSTRPRTCRHAQPYSRSRSAPNPSRNEHPLCGGRVAWYKALITQEDHILAAEAGIFSDPTAAESMAPRSACQDLIERNIIHRDLLVGAMSRIVPGQMLGPIIESIHRRLRTTIAMDKTARPHCIFAEI